MLEEFKKALYFPIASYFRFFAAIRLRKWNPTVIVVTGSNGKTTLLHLLEAQLKGKAKYSHHANSAYGIPFDILDLHRKTLRQSEWIGLFLKAPFQIAKPSPKEKIYVVEADADRPNEGKFLSELLDPTVTLWVSTSRTHSLNFDHLVADGTFKTVDEAIAYEYGHFVRNARKLAVVDGESHLERKQVHETKATVIAITKSVLHKYSVDGDGTTFKIKDKTIHFDALLPEEIYLSIAMCMETMEYLQMEFDTSFHSFAMPPGRGTLLKGIKETTIIDSTYNANLKSISVMVHLFQKFPAKKKWVVIGDMLELGKEEQSEHELLADLLKKSDLEQIVLVGKLVSKYTFEVLKDQKNVHTFVHAKDALGFIEKNIAGGETILLKGSQSILLEGIVEHLLVRRSDAEKLPRQTAFWQMKRKRIGL